MTNSGENRTITIRDTPEMANWMHPQTEERSDLIRKRTQEAKARFSQINRNPILRKAIAQAVREGINPNVEIIVGPSHIVTIRNGVQIPSNKVVVHPKMLKKFRRVPLTAQHKTN